MENKFITKHFMTKECVVSTFISIFPLVENITKEIVGLRMDDGMDPGTFRDILYRMMYQRRRLVKNTHEVITGCYSVQLCLVIYI